MLLLFDLILLSLSCLDLLLFPDLRMALALCYDVTEAPGEMPCCAGAKHEPRVIRLEMKTLTHNKTQGNNPLTGAGSLNWACWARPHSNRIFVVLDYI